MSQRFLCFGELLLRLGAPGRERLLQSARLDVHVGGAEANVAVGLAGFGHAVGMLGVVADNALGTAALGELRARGVDTSRVTRAAGRMGLYFLETGAGHRPSDVLYDRADSAFVRAAPGSYDWPGLLAGARVLHLSGVTPALGLTTAIAAADAARAARALGIDVIFDGNFRAKLWQAWNGDAPAILRGLIGCADIAFADHRDIGIALGQDFGSEVATALPAAAAAAFSHWPNLQRLICTERVQHSVDRHRLSAHMYTRTENLQAPGYDIDAIVDRIGGGDAFAAGVLHGLYSGMQDAHTLRFGLAAGCLKHSIPGDVLRAGVAEVQALVDAAGYGVRR